jgi:hypothetical protein
LPGRGGAEGGSWEGGSEELRELRRSWSSKLLDAGLELLKGRRQRERMKSTQIASLSVTPGSLRVDLTVVHEHGQAGACRPWGS